MNYHRIYSELILRAKNRSILPDQYTEKHHILPRSIYPAHIKEEWNLVKLFPEEHLIAHLLLVKIYPKDKKMIYAANMMTNMRCVNNKKYRWVRKEYAVMLSSIMKVRMSGDNNPAKRPEVRTKMRKPKSEQGRENIRKAIAKQNRKKENNSFYGKKHTVDNLEKAVNNRKANNDGNYHPTGNRTAKTFLFISPDGIKYTIFNGANKFCESHNISWKLLRSLKGLVYNIQPNCRRITEKSLNTVGWSVIEIEKA